MLALLEHWPPKGCNLHYGKRWEVVGQGTATQLINFEFSMFSSAAIYVSLIHLAEILSPLLLSALF